MSSRAPAGGAAVLIGFMGVGKSCVGREVARLLRSEFVDLDERIESAAGCSVAEIFALRGEGAFRELEREAIRQAVSVPGRVVAAGGGAFCDAGNRSLLKAYAPVVFLDASPETLVRRLSRDETRPLLQGRDLGTRVRELLARRRPEYERADFTVGTDGRTARQVAGRVVDLVGSRKGGRR